MARRIETDVAWVWHRLFWMISVIVMAGCAGFLSTPIADPPPIIEGPQWQTVAAGLEARLYRPNGDESLVRLLALRVDPTLYTFRAHYRPGSPLSLAQWREELPGAVAFINANFFDNNNEILGLLVADGAVFGQSYTNRGGMFAIDASGVPDVRSVRLEPYGGEPLQQAVQAFPMLVHGGARTQFRDNGRSARRTVIGEDAQGNIVLMATSFGVMGLQDLSGYLPTTDMNLVEALNLDGGGSTMLYYAVPGAEAYQLPAFDRVPAVLAVYKR